MFSEVHGQPLRRWWLECRRHEAETVSHFIRSGTFASWLAIASVSLRRIQELLGHKSIVTTERPSHLGGNGLRPYFAELAKAVAVVLSPVGWQPCRYLKAKTLPV